MIGLSVLGVGSTIFGGTGSESNPALLFPTIIHAGQTLMGIMMGLIGLLILFLSKKINVASNKIKNKIFSFENLTTQVNSWKESNQKIVFTNGCFDIIHQGHIEVCLHCDLGDKLIIGLNSDSSIQNLKGKNRPIIEENSRALSIRS